MRPRITALAAFEECAAVAQQRDSIPSDSFLAAKYRISESYVRTIMKAARRGLKLSAEHVFGLGEKFEGTPCPAGHTQRYRANGSCVACQLVYNRRSRQKKSAAQNLPASFDPNKAFHVEHDGQSEGREEPTTQLSGSPEKAALS